MTANCPICSVEARLTGAPYLGVSKLFNDRELATCPDCGLVFCFPEIDSKILDQYNKDYFFNAHNQEVLTKNIECYFQALL